MFIGAGVKLELGPDQTAKRIRRSEDASSFRREQGPKLMTDEVFDDLALRLEARVGLTLKDKWRLDHLLGVGGMASVYAATHRNGKQVAVKMLHPELSMNAAIRQRFLREGYVANSVKHPGAVSVDDDDVAEDGCAFLVMELLDGETLEARLDRKGRHLDETEVLSLMDQVLDTLSAAHENGIIHRDLKPENLFLTHTGQVKVLDFGIARVREMSATGSRTQTGSPMGTPAFMPPEQARGLWAEVDERSDLWAVGATMFALLTGRPVHDFASVSETLVAAVTQHAPSVGNLGVPIHRAVAALVDRALLYEKAERWPNAGAMQEALREAYVAIANKPITLLDAIEDDIPSRQFGSPASTGPQGVTAMGGVVAAGSARGSASRDPRWKRSLAIAVGAMGVAVCIGLFLLVKHADAPPVTSGSVERGLATAPVTAVEVDRWTAPSADVAPIVPLERIPTVAVPATAPVVAVSAAHPKPIASHASAVAIAAASAPAPSTPKSAPPSGDPFAARH